MEIIGLGWARDWLKMKKLINDVGLEQYDAVRKAYDRAKALLAQEKPDRKDLVRLLNILDANKEGVNWLRDEEGKKYDIAYNALKQKIPCAFKVSHLAIILFNKQYVIRMGTGYMVERMTEKINTEIQLQFMEQVFGQREKTEDYELFYGTKGFSPENKPAAEYLSPELSASIEDYCEHILNGKQFDKDYIENTRRLIASMVYRGVQ